jgi:hypothetical protein
MTHWILVLVFSMLVAACGADKKSPLDSDGDGIADKVDVFPNDPRETLDTDGDGVGDNSDAFPSDASETLDTDKDGIGDNADVFPNDSSESLDSDDDQVGDNTDAFPFDASETKDLDGDGVGDNADLFPSDASETQDTDKDGVGDNGDVFPSDPTESKDSDGDAVGDNSDLYPLNAQEHKDSDGDGIGDNRDAFDLDASENTDTDSDGIGNNRDNCFLTSNPNQRDTNADGLGDACSFNDTGVVYSTHNDVSDYDYCRAYIPGDQHNIDNIIETQDCSNGRDADFLADEVAFNAAKVGAGIAAFDFSKIAANGDVLEVSAPEWACIRDNVTGLMWEKKSDNSASIHYKLHAYSWYSSENSSVASAEYNEPNMKLSAYDTHPSELRSCDGTYDEAIPSTYCNTEAYLQRVSDTYPGGLCGKSNWRLPTINELTDIANFGFEPDPANDELNNKVNYGFEAGKTIQSLGIDQSFFTVADYTYTVDRQLNFTGEYFSSSTRGEENQSLPTQQLKWVQSFIDPHSRLLKQANIGGHIMLVADPE